MQPPSSDQQSTRLASKKKKTHKTNKSFFFQRRIFFPQAPKLAKKVISIPTSIPLRCLWRGSSGDQWLECLICRQESEHGHLHLLSCGVGRKTPQVRCVGKIQVSEPQPQARGSPASSWHPVSTGKAGRIPEGEAREEESYTPGLRALPVFMFSPILPPRLPRFSESSSKADP